MGGKKKSGKEAQARKRFQDLGDTMEAREVDDELVPYRRKRRPRDDFQFLDLTTGQH